MKFNIRYVEGILLLALTCALVSCGKKGTESKIQPGNLSDPAYLEALNTTIESAKLSGNAVATAIDRVSSYLSFSPQLSASPGCHVETYAYESGWHQVTYDNYGCYPAYYWTSVDSFQIKNKAGEPQQTVDTTDLGSIEVSMKFHLVSNDIYADFLGEVNLTADIIFTSINNSTVTINGTMQEDAQGSFLHPDSGIWCSLDRMVDYDLNNISIPITNNLANSCQGSTGQLVASASLDLVCPFESDTFHVSGVWTTAVTSNTQSVTVVTQQGQTQWTQSFSQTMLCGQVPLTGLKFHSSLRPR